MKSELRKYIESVFEDAPKTRKAVELKEEILQNTIDKYNDLISDGKSEEAAFNIAVAGIGDIGELIKSLKEDYSIFSPYSKEEIEKSKKRSALYTSFAVMLYITSALPILLAKHLDFSVAICITVSMVALATGLLIFNNLTKINYTKIDDTMVEDFKEWKVKNKEENSLLKSINAAIWSIALVIYFLVSFSTGAWHLTWLILVITSAFLNLIKAVFDLKNKK